MWHPLFQSSATVASSEITQKKTRENKPMNIIPIRWPVVFGSARTGSVAETEAT